MSPKNLEEWYQKLHEQTGMTRKDFYFSKTVLMDWDQKIIQWWRKITCSKNYKY